MGKRKYIIFYAHMSGCGNCELTYGKIKKIEHIKELEKEISNEIGYTVSITNYKMVGYTWK